MGIELVICHELRGVGLPMEFGNICVGRIAEIGNGWVQDVLLCEEMNMNPKNCKKLGMAFE